MNNKVFKSCSWKKKLAKSFKNWQELANFLEIDQSKYNIPTLKKFPMRVPLSFAMKMKKNDINDPLLRQVLPLIDELKNSQGYVNDPLQEKKFYVSNRLLHKYKNRVLLMTHPTCAVHCRYCFRREYDYKTKNHSTIEDWLKAFKYVKDNHSLDEVILSGGDPLMQNDKFVQFIILQIEEIPHIKRLRVHTRIPIVFPERITKELITIFQTTKKLQKIMVIHANHANEISNDVVSVLKKLKNAGGFSLFNQSTLLKGVNDNVDALKLLSESLFYAGVIPYYLHVLDKVKGAKHFDIEYNIAKKIHNELKSSTSGYLVPKLVREIPNEHSKTWI